MSEDTRVGRRSSDADLAVVVERLDQQDLALGRIEAQTIVTNGRVSELEIKWRIHEDRASQKAITVAASEAAVSQAEKTGFTKWQKRWAMVVLASGWGATIVTGLLGSHVI